MAPNASRLTPQQIESQAKAEWSANADLQAEFPSSSTYVAYKLAIANGQAKIYAGGSA